MSDIKGGSYIYHLTSLGNVASIIERGLLPRRDLKNNNTKFQDIADPEILASRKGLY